MPRVTDLLPEERSKCLPGDSMTTDTLLIDETPNHCDRVIPRIEIRDVAVTESLNHATEIRSDTSPIPSSPDLTACETSSTISIEDNTQLVQLDHEQRGKMIAEVFTQLDQLIGLSHVKTQFLQIKKMIETYRWQGVDLKRERFHIKFLGNSGTGKTTVARLYAKLLLAMGILEHTRFVETSGAELVSGGILDAAKLLHSGVVFIDEAYQLVAQHHPGGRQLVDIIQTKMENRRGHLVLIFAGYSKDMEQLIEHNIGLNSRIPDTIYFDDFNSNELLTILKRKINKKFGGRMQIEAHPDDVDESRYLRIVANRLGRGRGIRGFGNARSVENQLQRISKRQIQRLDSLPAAERDYFTFTREDIIGPHPSEAKFKSEAWTELQSLIGLEKLKAQCRTLISLCETNYERELRGLDPEMLSLNGIFMGSPGTGKTTVASLYGNILADLGLLSDGEVVIKKPSDLIGETLGSSEARTRAILVTTIGKVLIIDEAYGLGSMTSGSNSGAGVSSQDSFRAGVIDTIVGEVHGAPGEDRCILLLGYQDKLRDMFQKSNPGLSSRFNYSSPFRFEDFTIDQLMEILHHKMARQQVKATTEALETARDVLERASLNPEYGNARAVENCLQSAKKRYRERHQVAPTADWDYEGNLEPEDFDPDHTIKASGFTDCEKLLNGMVSKSVIKQISRLQQQAVMARLTNGNKFRDIVPTNLIFRGPSGTGKTTLAKLMGRIYYNLGVVATDEVIEISVRDLIAPFVGQTRQKTKNQLSHALGKVLVIDHAFQLLKGPFEMEALQEVITSLQSDDFARKMIVILVGYAEEMKLLMYNHPPLASLFPYEVKFPGLQAKDCMKLLENKLEKLRVSAPFVRDSKCDDYQRLERLIRALVVGPAFANAKDIESLAQAMKSTLFDDFFKKNKSKFTHGGSRNLPDMPDLSKTQATDCVKRFINQRKCMNTPSQSVIHDTMEYSDHDFRFARAFAFEQMPVMEIRIEQAYATSSQVTSLHVDDDENDDDDDRVFDDTLAARQLSNFQLPVINPFLALIPGLTGSLSSAVPVAENLRYFKSLRENDHLHRRPEEIDDDDGSDNESQETSHLQSQSCTSPQTKSTYIQNSDTPAALHKASDSAVITDTEAVKISRSVGAIHQDEFLKETSDMDREELQRYRNMLKHKYPFEERVSERTERALHDLGYCPAGYAWKRDLHRHICLGGCHYGYDFNVRDYMHRNGL